MYHTILNNAMGLITGQQISTYYDTYCSTEVAFTKQINQAFGLNPKEIFLKSSGNQWNCIIYSSSMESAKVLLNLDEESAEELALGGSTISLRYSIKKPDAASPISFFVPGKVTSVTTYSEDKQNLKFLTMTFSQRPPDDLIEMLGTLLETAMNSQKRKEERIVIVPNIMKLLGITSKEISLLIQNISCRGILRDLSFSGLKAIAVGQSNIFQNKETEVTIETEDKALTIPGKIIRVDPVEERKELTALSVAFKEDQIPMEYKMKLNDYFSRGRLEITPKED